MDCNRSSTPSVYECDYPVVAGCCFRIFFNPWTGKPIFSFNPSTLDLAADALTYLAVECLEADVRLLPDDLKRVLSSGLTDDFPVDEFSRHVSCTTYVENVDSLVISNEH